MIIRDQTDLLVIKEYIVRDKCFSATINLPTENDKSKIIDEFLLAQQQKASSLLVQKTHNVLMSSHQQHDPQERQSTTIFSTPPKRTLGWAAHSNLALNY